MESIIIGFIFVVVFFTFFGIKITIHGKDKQQSGGEMVDATVKSSVSEDNLTKVRDIQVRILS